MTGFGALKGAPNFLPAPRRGKPDFGRLDPRRARNAPRPRRRIGTDVRVCMNYRGQLEWDRPPNPAASALSKRRIGKHLRPCKADRPFPGLRSVSVLAANSEPPRWLPLFWRPSPESGMALDSTWSWRTSCEPERFTSAAQSVPLDNEDGNIAFGDGQSPAPMRPLTNSRFKLSSKWNDRAGCALSNAAS